MAHVVVQRQLFQGAVNRPMVLRYSLSQRCDAKNRKAEHIARIAERSVVGLRRRVWQGGVLRQCYSWFQKIANLGNSKIADFRDAFRGDQNVRWLNVAMDYGV